MKIFVYGTLKSGHCRAHFLNGQHFVGFAQSAPNYRMVNCGDYPGLIAASDGLSIEGELWDVDAACLEALDREECLDVGLYARRSIELRAPYETTLAEAYYYLGDTRGMPDCGNCW